ncbi:Endo-1%2C4-beta-xylanase Y precursor [uncultured Blautia sp.]|uniref:alpha/beta hydrolase-fold protein n=1 Tax=uncultured Clostridium sp. TaxID=59620 RepID=UPI0008213133|nr:MULTISPECIES: alpha/beta hydrolase-fold protein [Clostridia]SCJ25189.1 Endo-1%2C4-beta-xylanase Y precursor [uncultured Clostridium sp.]SCJ91984.1 Endo-1%2C4-beta-xylanase Y precursor [uncultured Blautia sp.]
MKKELEEKNNIMEKTTEKTTEKTKHVWKWICFIPAVILILLSGIDILRFAILGDKTAFITFSLIAVVFILVAYTAWKSRIPVLYLVIAVAAFVLYFNTNFSTSTYYFNWLFLVEAVVAALGGILGIAAIIRVKIATGKATQENRIKRKTTRMAYFPAMAAVVILAGFLGFWKVRYEAAHNAQGQARDELWAVPAKYDETEPTQPGTVEEVVYNTKAYATDERDVKKTAYVYLPYGYDSEKEYNILYLMHGTGDDEKYWLKTNPYNKIMLDNMIADGDIQPLIVVTPTFYVEDDCADDLDQLTYSFAKELRNDLMPEIESSYSTYAKSADDKGFSESRDHRAFAGLSRGAVTTYHSAICQSLDYFSWFGTFSGSRTDAQQFQDTIQSGTFADLPIHYLYVASGNFDFALPGQVQDYQALLDIEPRLRAGVNTCFDVFPMRYHSMGNWHLALYNYLKKIF